MKVSIKPSRLHGIVKAPASKSSMQRACAAAWISGKDCSLLAPGHSKDDLVGIDIITRLGADVKSQDGIIHISKPRRENLQPEIFCGESGLSMRMFTPLAALSSREITIHGSGTLLKRPMGFFDQVLPELGVKVQSNNGFLPIKVQGPLVPANIEIDGSLSSQFLTGLIMAYVASGADDVSIHVKDLQSKPYIDLTLSVLGSFGLPVPENRNYEEFYFSTSPNLQQNERIEYQVESDWSGGAFLLVAGALAGPIMVTGLDLSSRQADRAIVDVLMNANASIAMEAKGIRIHPSGLAAFETDASDYPDLFPPLVVLASRCQGRSVIRGIRRLYHKESNRAITLQEEFGKMGVLIELNDDEMIITGTPELKGAEVRSHGDHRIAMALAVAALKATGETCIEQAEVVEKSYPDFYMDLKKLGAELTLPIRYRLHE